MPTYDYRCDANGRTLEVRHAMHKKVRTWGELCAILDLDPGKTRAREPVRKVITRGNVITSEALDNSATTPPCAGGSGPACGRGMCGM